ncbi:MAG: hypothetical protein ACTIJ6_11380 [Leucobacter sp.]
MTENTSQAPISWEAERANLPERPVFSSNLNAETLIPRPRRTLIAAAAFVVAALASVATIVSGVLALDELRATIVSALPDDITTEYSDESVQQAATVLLAVAAAILLVALVVQALSLSVCVRRRSRAARVTFSVTSIATLLAIGVGFVLRDPSTWDLALSATASALVLFATALICTARVTRWLRQSEGRRAIVLADAVSARPADSA